MNGGVGTTMNGSTTGMKKDPTDLIIGSWNDEDAEKVSKFSQCCAIGVYNETALFSAPKCNI